MTVSPAENHLGWFAMLVPVAGGLIIGLIARYGSERIRGHGIPEALESILIHGSKIQPRLAILKPVSAATSIGSGGPFGAEGPIIMTVGVLGSVIAQLFHLTAAERKTLLIAGAAAGMSATFATPVAAVLLAVELLLFEWKPRSAIPVALASAAAGAARRYILGLGPPLSRASACDLYRTGRPGRVCTGGVVARWLFRPSDARRVCGGRLVYEAAYPLEVVAGDRRAGSWLGRINFSASLGRRIRHDSIAASR